MMKIKSIPYDFTVCKVQDFREVNLAAPYCFTARTDHENSLVCRTENAPKNTLSRQDGWRAFRIEGTLDFSLIGILADISTLLAQEKIGILALSTYDTDYILVKKEHEKAALNALQASGRYELTEKE